MQHDEPSREELISQIADVIGKAKPPPSKKEQFLSVVTSVLVRTVCVAYSVYLAYLFAIKFADLSSDDYSPLTATDRLVFYTLSIFILYTVYRRVWGDRFTPAINMIRQIIFRFTKIIVTFLFWNLIFNWFSDLKESFFAFVGTMFIAGSGYDFRLRDRAPAAPPPVS